MSFDDYTTTEDHAVAAAEPAEPKVKEGSADERQGDFLLLRKATNGLQPGVYRELRAKSGKTYWHRICAPLEILANTRTSQGQGWGRFVAFTDPDGTEHRWAIPARLLEGDGVDMRSELADLGLAIMPDRRAREGLAAYIATWSPPKSIRCVERVGWHDRAFILPDAAFGATEETVVQTTAAVQPFVLAGTLAGWQEQIARHAAGNSRLAFAISLGFAGALISLVDEESGGVHIYGKSSSGKTTALDVARSVPGLPRGSWRTTENAAEALAAGACDTLLTLDEIAEAPPRVVSEISYMLGNQRGKARLSRTTALRSPMTWRILFLSTGELPIAAKLLEGGHRVMAGQTVRVIELPAECGAGPGMGVFDRLPAEFATGYDFAMFLKAAVERHHGHPFRAFLARLTSDLPAATIKVRETRRGFMRDHEPRDADGQVRRVLGRIGMIAAAGELATEYGITGWLPGEALDAARKCFNAWLAQRGGTGPAEETAALEQVRFFLEKHGDARFQELGGSQSGVIRDRAGFRSSARGDDGWTYFVLPEVFRREVCKGLDHTAVAQLLLDRGWLRAAADRLTPLKRISGEGSVRVYVILPSFLTEAGPPDEPDDDDDDLDAMDL